MRHYMDHRLGMAAIRWELEDLCFKFLEPDAYEALIKLVKQRRKEREREILELQRPLQEALEQPLAGPHGDRATLGRTWQRSWRPA